MRITSVEAVPLAWHLPRERMRWWSDYGPRTEIHALIVRVRTDEGITGYGEVHLGYGYTRWACYAAKTIVEKELAPIVIGGDATRPELLWEQMYNDPRSDLALRYGHSCPRLGRRGLTVCAMSGIEMAVWDVFARSLGVPIHKLLGGGYRDRLPAYASGGHAPPEHAAEEAISYLEKGFRAIKMRVGGMDAPEIPRRSVERVRIVREAIGPEVMLMIDAHGSLNVRQAIRLAREVEEFDIAWFEEPVSSDNWRGMAQVRLSTVIPIATGENDFTQFDFRDIIRMGAADILQPDLAVCGGFTSARRIAALAQAEGLQCVPHVWGSAILFVASLHLAAAIPNCPIFEFRQDECALFNDLISEPLTIDEEGYVSVPQGPGLGVEFDLDEAARKFPFEG